MSVSLIFDENGLTDERLRDECRQCRETRDGDVVFDETNCVDQLSFEALNRNKIYKTSDDGVCYNHGSYARWLRPKRINPRTKADLTIDLFDIDAISEAIEDEAPNDAKALFWSTVERANQYVFQDIEMLLNVASESDDEEDYDFSDEAEKLFDATYELATYFSPDEIMFFLAVDGPNEASSMGSRLFEATLPHAKKFDARLARALDSVGLQTLTEKFKKKTF